MFEKIYGALEDKYGKPAGQWKLWCKKLKINQEKEEVMIGAILTQRTNWKNVELAISNLRKAKVCSISSIHRLGAKKLGPLIKPSGFYKMKAGYLLNLADFIIKKYGSIKKMSEIGLERLRGELLEIKGIGPETADSILLYGLDKRIFVIDEYTRRLARARNLSKNMDYHFLQKLFQDNIKKDFRTYQDFHALIVINGKN